MVRHTIPVLVLAIAVVSFAEARKGPSDASVQEVVALENKWVEALTKADEAALGAIFADGYVDTDEHSQRSDKDGVLAVLKSGDLKLESIKLADMKVRVYGDAAVAIGSATQAGTFLGRPLASKIIFTDTLVKQGGKWKAVASHRSSTE